MAEDIPVPVAVVAAEVETIEDVVVEGPTDNVVVVGVVEVVITRIQWPWLI